MSSAIPVAVGTAGVGFCCVGSWMLLEHCRQVEGRNVDNEPGPNADVMALSAVADTIAEYKRALARDDFKVEMSLDDRERAVLVGTDDHAMSYASPGRRLTLNSTSRRRSASDGIFNLIAGPDHEISKEELLVYLYRVTGAKTEDSGLTEAVICALFAAADEEQDGKLREHELVTFMRLYKYYCYTFTSFGKGDRAFRDTILAHLQEEAQQSERATAEEKHEDTGVEDAAITIHRVEHLPAAGEDGSLDAMVVAYQSSFELNEVDATPYADNDDDDVGKWSAAERKIGSTEARPAWVHERRWDRLSWKEALWTGLGWPAETVKFNSRHSFKCSAPGTVVLKLVDDNWSSDKVIGEARVAIQHPSDLGHDGEERMFRAALYHPSGSQPMIDAYMNAPPWDGKGFPFYGKEYAGDDGALVLGKDGFPTIVVFSLSDWDERDRTVLSSSRRRRRRR